MTKRHVHLGREGRTRRHAVQHVDNEVVLLLGVQDLIDSAVFGRDRPSVADLSTAFGVEGRAVKHGLHQGFLLGGHFTVAQQLDGAFRVVVANELGGPGMLVHNLPVVGSDFAGLAGAVLLGIQQGLEPAVVHLQFFFACNQGRQVHGKAKRVVQFEHQLSGQDISLAQLGCGSFQTLHPRGQGPQKRLLFLLNDLLDESALRLDFREGVRHLVVQHAHEFVDERFVHAQERGAITDGTAEDAANHIARSGVGRELSVSNGERNGPDVVGDDPERNGLLAVVFGVGLATMLGDGVEKGREDVGVVVRGHTLHGHGQAFESHPRVDVLVGKRHQGAVRHAVELHEHQVPNLNHLRVVLVDHGTSVHLLALLVAAEVDVDFGTRPAGSRFPHLPEVVFFVGVQNAVVLNVLAPLFSRLVVCGEPVSGIAPKHRHVQPVFVQSIAVGQQLPRPIDGLGLEVVAKRPIAEHLEQRVVVGVHPDLFQIVVFAADAQALLGVGNSCVLHRLVAQKQVLERVHPRIDEHQRGIVFDHHGRRRNNVVSFFLEEVQKSLSDAP